MLYQIKSPVTSVVNSTSTSVPASCASSKVSAVACVVSPEGKFANNASVDPVKNILKE
jgi:hypothetical protein